MRLKSYILLVVLSLATFVSFQTKNVFAQKSGGGLPASFLLRETGSRPIALAGAYTAVSNDPYTMFYNPAGLSYCAPVPMIITNLSLLDKHRTHAIISYAQSIEQFGIGVALNSYTTGGIVARNAQGVQIGNYTDFLFNLSAGASFSTDFASFGATAKYINNSLQGSGISANGFSFDVGSKFNVMDMFSFGVVVQNIGGSVKYNTRAESGSIPYTIRSGVAMEFPLSEPTTIVFRNQLGELDSVVQPSPQYVLISFEGNFTQHEKHPTFIFATEIAPHEIIVLRGGIAVIGEYFGEFKLFPMSVWGGGVSIRPNFESFPNLFSIDFSVGNDYISNNNIFYSLAVTFQF
jgi:hypothetical protein